MHRALKYYHMVERLFFSSKSFSRRHVNLLIGLYREKPNRPDNSHIFWSPNVHYPVDKTCHSIPFLGIWIKLIITPTFFEIFILRKYRHVLQVIVIAFYFSTSHLQHACYIPYPFHPICSEHLNKIFWRINVVHGVIFSSNFQFLSSGFLQYILLSTHTICSKLDISTAAAVNHELYWLPLSYWKRMYLQIINGKVSKRWD
jgi:hypothetical protein